MGNCPFGQPRFRSSGVLPVLLAHSNTRLFITHAGLLSTQEAIYHGVPTVSVPIIADQDANAVRGVELGIGVMVEIIGATEEAIAGAIKEVLGNSRQVNSYPL